MEASEKKKFDFREIITSNEFNTAIVILKSIGGATMAANPYVGLGMLGLAKLAEAVKVGIESDEQLDFEGLMIGVNETLDYTLEEAGIDPETLRPIKESE